MSDILSAYIQCYSNKKAVYECLKSFRSYYPDVKLTLVSDAGDDFSEMIPQLNFTFKYENKNILPKGKMIGIDGVKEYLKRIYTHCLSVDTDWVLLLEEDVKTLRKIKYFPSTECAGPRMNSYSPQLTQFLINNYGNKQYGYGMSGASVFKRQAFITSYNNFDLDQYLTYDDRLSGWGDIPLTLLFHVNNFNYSVWDEISETTHPSPIVRDAAFDHAYKYWYNKEG